MRSCSPLCSRLSSGSRGGTDIHGFCQSFCPMASPAWVEESRWSLWPKEARRSWGCTKMRNSAGWLPFLASWLFPCAHGVGTRATCQTPALRWTEQHLKITPHLILQCIWQDRCEFVVTREYISGKLCVKRFCQQLNILKKTLVLTQNRKHLNSS